MFTEKKWAGCQHPRGCNLCVWALSTPSLCLPHGEMCLWVGDGVCDCKPPQGNRPDPVPFWRRPPPPLQQRKAEKEGRWVAVTQRVVTLLVYHKISSVWMIPMFVSPQTSLFVSYTQLLFFACKPDHLVSDCKPLFQHLSSKMLVLLLSCLYCPITLWNISSLLAANENSVGEGVGANRQD